MTKLEKIGLKWLNDNYGDLEIFITEKYLNNIYYMKNGKYIYHYNTKNGYVYVSYDEIWSFFESYFGMEYQQIKDLTKIWAEEQYKLVVTLTEKLKQKGVSMVEEQYKLEVTSTESTGPMYIVKVEGQYKLETK